MTFQQDAFQLEEGASTMRNVIGRYLYGAIQAYRQFEPGGLTTYVVTKEHVQIGSTVYRAGDVLPLGIVSDARLEIIWNGNQIDNQS